MLVDFRIKLTSPFLGNSRTPEQIRRFHRKGDGIELDHAQYRWALDEASKGLAQGVVTSNVRFPDVIRSPRLDRYIRKWNDKGRTKEEWFECVNTGAELSIDVFIAETPEDGKGAAMTPAQFEAAMVLVGSHIGLSPWGSKFGYGKFAVMHVKQK